MYLAQVVKKQKIFRRQYKEDYIQYEFGNEDVVTKMLQNRSALFVWSNLQIKQWFLINLCATLTRNMPFMHTRIKNISSGC